MFDNIPEKEIEDEDWNKLVSIIQKANILNIDEAIFFEEPAENMREAIAINNQKIYQFDDTQLNASLTIANKAERIRGLAGTGKTVILSIKAAKLHRKYPEARIAYVFYTHSLYKQTTSLIRKYYNKIVGSQPNWEKLEVLHAWGGKTVGPGLYYNTCINNGIIPDALSDVMEFNNPFGKVCEKLLNKSLKQEYDFILIDEAQDMPVEFFKLVEKITKDPKRIIIAYDELQTTSNIKLPEFEELFGIDVQGNPKVPLKSENDYILKISYRNHRDVLMTAFAFGFGFYSEDGITQIIRDLHKALFL